MMTMLNTILICGNKANGNNCTQTGALLPPEQRRGTRTSPRMYPRSRLSSAAAIFLGLGVFFSLGSTAAAQSSSLFGAPENRSTLTIVDSWTYLQPDPPKQIR